MKKIWRGTLEDLIDSGEAEYLGRVVEESVGAETQYAQYYRHNGKLYLYRYWSLDSYRPEAYEIDPSDLPDFSEPGEEIDMR